MKHPLLSQLIDSLKENLNCLPSKRILRFFYKGSPITFMIMTPLIAIVVTVFVLYLQTGTTQNSIGKITCIFGISVLFLILLTWMRTRSDDDTQRKKIISGIEILKTYLKTKGIPEIIHLREEITLNGFHYGHPAYNLDELLRLSLLLTLLKEKYEILEFHEKLKKELFFLEETQRRVYISQLNELEKYYLN